MNFTWLKALGPWLLPSLYVAALLAYGQAQWSGGFAQARAEGELALSTLRLTQTGADLVKARRAENDAKEFAKTLTTLQARADGLASTLAEQQRQHRKTTDRLSGEIARVNDLYRDALDAPPKPLPACVFTAGWVRVYNEATGAGTAAVRPTGGTGGTAAPPRSSAPFEQLSSGVSQAQLLAHHVQYAEQCRNTATQLDLLIDQVTGK